MLILLKAELGGDEKMLLFLPFCKPMFERTGDERSESGPGGPEIHISFPISPALSYQEAY